MSADPISLFGEGDELIIKFWAFGRHKALISLTDYIHPGPNVTHYFLPFLRAVGTGAGASLRLPPLGAATGACLRAFAAEGFGAIELYVQKVNPMKANHTGRRCAPRRRLLRGLRARAHPLGPRDGARRVAC